MSAPTTPLTDVSLTRHPQTPCPAVQQVAVALHWAAPRDLQLRYVVRGDMARLRLPSPQLPAPQDRLWAHTCCEAFIASRDGDCGRGPQRDEDRGPTHGPNDGPYCEWNFSPSGQFAHYDFSDYRQRCVAHELVAPALRVDQDAAMLCIETRIAVPAGLGDRLRIGLSTVIESADGTLAYWALRHPAGKPDFHHREAFALALDLAPTARIVEDLSA